MNKKVLIVEDQFVEANDISLMLQKAGYEVSGIARSVAVALEMIQKDKPGLVLLDIFLKGKLTGIDLARILKEENIAFIYLSANSNEEILTAAKMTEPYGFIVKPFREKDLLVTLEIAQYRHEHGIESKYRREDGLQRGFEQIAAGKESWMEKLAKTAAMLQQYIPFDYITGGFNTIREFTTIACSFLRLGFDEYQTIGLSELSTITRQGIDQIQSLSTKVDKELTPGFYNNESFEKITQEPSLTTLISRTFDMRSCLVLPLQLANGQSFVFCCYSRRADVFNFSHIHFFNRLKQDWAGCIEKMLVHASAGIAAIPVPIENAGFNNTRHGVQGFTGIIGKCHLLLNVFDHISQVAPYDTSVLILGESGTGKERIANAIHYLSPRKDKAFIKINCAALPAALIESELFGHERGAFTGATDKRTGKFEQAHGGTIFLDEIGEMPVDLQVKLLRVLQEKEIEPIGGKSTIKVNVRIIAATNRNLEKEVAENRFRLDLYYRLNIFPIQLPPLRERIEDIDELVYYFVDMYSRKSGKKITAVSARTMNNMKLYTWPGNIRELENIIERSVLLAKGDIIDDIVLPVTHSHSRPVPTDELHIKTIFENEKDHILSVLKKVNGRIWGPGGAAEILNVPPTTLSSKMKKLGIKKMFNG